MNKDKGLDLIKKANYGCKKIVCILTLKLLLET